MDRGRVVAAGTAEELKSGLRGDALVVELAAAAAPDLVAAALGRLPLRELAVDGRTLRARADDGARAVPAVLGELETAGLAAVSATVSRPSLEDVYLRLTGHAFDAADELAGAAR